MQILQLHVSPFLFFIFLLNSAVEFAFFMTRGSLFQRRAPLNTVGLTPNELVFLFGICNRFAVLNSYLMCFLSKSVHMKDGLYF